MFATESIGFPANFMILTCPVWSIFYLIKGLSTYYWVAISSLVSHYLAMFYIHCFC